MAAREISFAVSVIIISSAFLMAAGCLGGDDGAFDLVVVSVLPQKEMVESISGSGIRVEVMVPEGQSPHGYSPTPGQLLDITKADLYFKVGSGVEFELNHIGTLTETNPDMVVIDTSKGIDVKSFDEHLGADDHSVEEGEITSENGDDHDHEGTDPHIWLSPSNMKIMAGNVRSALIEHDPENGDLYDSNYEAYIGRLEEAIGAMKEKLDPHAGEEFLVYHPAWGYFGDEFGLIQLSIEEEGKKPGPQGIAAIIDQAREHNITVVFVSPQFDTSGARQIADEIGGEVVMVDSLAEDYIDNILEVADKMDRGLS
ncbi:MAG: metal ABC transporter solute-binding protein, Zn/Mn family [Thermoplasmatota archaeon]